MTVPFTEPNGKVASDHNDAEISDVDHQDKRYTVLGNKKRKHAANKDHESNVISNSSSENSKEVRYDTGIKEKTYKELGDLVDLKQLNICIKNDLTKQCINSLFPKVSIRKLAQKFKIAYDTDQITLTAGEKKILKDCFRNGQPVNSILPDLPLRNREYVEQKYKEIEFAGTRKTKFKNSFEKLLYEAQWTLMENTPGKRTTRSTRSRKNDLDSKMKSASLENTTGRRITRKTRIPKNSTDRELSSVKLESNSSRADPEKERRKRKALTVEKPKEKEMIQEIKKVEIEKRKNERLIKGITSKSFRKSSVEQLNITNEYFQTVTGNGEAIEYGMKRRRTQTKRFSPAIENKRTQLSDDNSSSKTSDRKQPTKLQVKTEASQKSILSKEIKKRSIQQSKKIQNIPKNLIKDEAGQKMKVEKGEKTKGNQEDINPFDPLSILNDSMVPLNKRQFFIPEFYQEEPHIPNLKFVEDNYHDSVTTKNDERFALTDFSAAQIVEVYHKNYRDLPISFPSLLISDPNSESKMINPNNKLKIRFLIYPQYTEEFILAQPKSNELNPVYEIQKLFQIHYALYFFHSKKIRKIIIDDYCKGLDDAIENNSFSDFMFTIDKWNQLMLELTPNSVDECKVDINKEIRIYLFGDDYRLPNSEDLKLDIFFYENSRERSPKNRIIEAPSPQYDIVEKKIIPDQSALTPPCSSEEDEKVNNYLKGKKYKFDEPKNIKIISDKSHFRKPQQYSKDFFSNLCQGTKISRFCLHQIFLRVYSRIVSTDSKKLREYRAFTAEVYGELLPSFTSEVLTKVHLLPEQRFYDLGSGVGNTTFQAALEFGACTSGGCELMPHASKLSLLQERLLQKHLALFGIGKLNLNFALNQSFVDNKSVKQRVVECDVLIVNNYLFDANLNNDVGRLLNDLKPGTKIISLRNFIRPRYKACGLNTVFDRLKVEKHEMSNFFSVSWTANKVPYYISTVQEGICTEYL